MNDLEKGQMHDFWIKDIASTGKNCINLNNREKQNEHTNLLITLSLSLGTRRAFSDDIEGSK